MYNKRCGSTKLIVLFFKIEGCIEQDSINNCALDNMDPSILPQGEHEWVCSSRSGKTICKPLSTALNFALDLLNIIRKY